jgi:hypothetical protein
VPPPPSTMSENANPIDVKMLKKLEMRPVADVDANATDDEVDELVDLGVEVRPVVDDVDVGVVPPRLHGPPITLSGQL